MVKWSCKVILPLLVILALLVNVSGSVDTPPPLNHAAPSHTTQPIPPTIRSPPFSPSIWDPPPSLAAEPILPPSTEPPQQAPQKKRKSQKRPAKYLCRHTNCLSGLYGERKAYTTIDKRNKHEQTKKGHTCLSSGGTCQRCTDITENNGWKRPKITKAHSHQCRHTGCNAKFTSSENRSHHESQTDLHKPEKCGSTCKGCSSVKRNQYRQDQRKEKEKTCSTPTCQPPVSEEAKKQAKELSALFRKFADTLDSLDGTYE